VYEKHAEADIAYTAGLFDGEGSISIVKLAKYPRFTFLQISVGNNFPEAIFFVQSLLGGYVTCVKSATRDQFYKWALKGKKAGQALRTLLPYLRITKEQAQLAIEFQELVNSGKHGFRNPITEDEIVKREEIRREISFLNAKFRKI
jgi:hypothetical protein